MDVLLVDVPRAIGIAVEREAAARQGRATWSRGEEALATARAEYALCLFRLSDGADVARRVRALRAALPKTPLVALCGLVGPEVIAQALRNGVSEVIAESNSVEEITRRSIECAAWGVYSEDEFGALGVSVSARQIARAVRSVGPTDSTVLLTGETGTGKGLVARLIHDWSKRAQRKFVHVDCAALSPTVIESEFFGHERGAFTGAVTRRVGRFELAERSTIFLDEIGDLEPPLQSKLLRVLQDREYERVGGTTTLTMSARVIAATSRNLRAAVERGEFRSDLYYRLSVVHIRIPALRERLGDIPHLVSSQLGAIATRLGVTAPEATPGFVRRLQEHDWPGNVRELFNTLERVCIERPGRRLEAFHLDGILEGHSSSYVAWSSVVRPASGREVASAPRGEARGTGARGQLDVERLTDILLQTGGNVTRAARRLGIPRGTLRYWIGREGLAHLIPND